MKSQGKAEDEVEEIPIEEKIEQQRALLSSHTPLTLDLFLQWKAKKIATRETEEQELKKKRKADISSGKVSRSGRELFELNPEMFADDEDAVAADDYTTNEPLEEGFEISATATSLTLSKVAGVAQKDVLSDYDHLSSADIASSEPPRGVAAVDASLFADEEIPDDFD